MWVIDRHLRERRHRAGRHGDDRAAAGPWSTRPARATAESDARRDPLRARRLPLRPAERRDRESRPDDPPGREGRPGRPLGRRQVDPGQPAAALLRPGRRPHPDRRPGHRRASRRKACARRSAWSRRTLRCCIARSRDNILYGRPDADARRDDRRGRAQAHARRVHPRPRATATGRQRLSTRMSASAA